MMMTDFGKKALSLLLGSLLAASFAACGAAPSSSTAPAASGGQTAPETPAAADTLAAEAGAEIEFTYWEGSPSDKDAWNAVLDKFEKEHPEIKLIRQVYPSNDYVPQLDTRIAGNDWPDVMRYTYQRLGRFKESDTMLDLTGMISEESLRDLVPAYRSALEYEGKLVGMPHHTDTIAVFYNKEMFAKSGIRIPASPADAWSWEELGEIAKKLKTDHNLPYAFAGIWENKSGYRYLPFIYMNGGAMLSEDMQSITIDQPKALEAIQLYESWVKDGLIAKTGFTQPPAGNAMFAAKQLAFVFGGSWHCSYMQENLPDNWAITYMPQVGGKSSSDLGGNGLFAYQGTKYPKAAAILIDYLSKPENMRLFCETGNFIPVRQSLIDEGLSFQSFQPEMDLFLEIVATIDPKMAADETSPKFQQLNVIFSEEMDPLIIGGSVTAEQVVAKMKTRMEEAMAE